jgi:predicted transcriptional regulator
MTASELDILEMLWREGAVTILQAQQALGLEIGYTTVQTRLNRLVKKGVATKSSTRPAQYSAAVTADEVQRHDLDLLVRRVSQGRVMPLFAHLLQRDDVLPEELAELKQLVAEAERQSQQAQRREGQQ